MNIYQKISVIMSNVQKLQKDDKIDYGKTSYKALSEEKVTTIMRQQLIEQGLVVYPVRQEASRNGNISHVDVVYRMVNIEDPTEYIEIASAGDGADTQDKGTGKAMTYAFKYMWLRTFALPTGEDPDKISSEQLDDEEQKRKEKEDLGGKIDAKKAKVLESMLKPNQIEWVLDECKVEKLADLTGQQFANIMNSLKAQEKAS